MQTDTLMAQGLLDFIDNSPTMFHAAKQIIKTLKDNDFTYLDPKNDWHLEPFKKYYTTNNDSAVIAFCTNTAKAYEEGFKMVGVHTDAPGFKIKPNPQICQDTYIKLNTEVYGGPIYHTWFDRPLSIAGRVMVKSENILFPKTHLVDLKVPLVIIPSLAIHMNREVNTGIAINPQKETLPILTYVNETLDANLLLTHISNTLNISQQDILDMELYLYPVEKSCTVGLNQEFLSAARLDDLSMAYSGLLALLANQDAPGIPLLAAFDNEEVGSNTKQGADSQFLAQTLERITLGLGLSKEAYFRTLANSFMVSCDVAHLTHPNYPEKADPTNKILPGSGPAIKMSASFSYTSDADSSSVFKALCEQHHIPYQIFVNRSDLRGGSTIGPVSTTHVSVRSVDIGTPMLSMHSARELMATQDFISTTKALTAFYAIRS